MEKSYKVDPARRVMDVYREKVKKSGGTGAAIQPFLIRRIKCSIGRPNKKNEFVAHHFKSIFDKVSTKKKQKTKSTTTKKIPKRKPV